MLVSLEVNFCSDLEGERKGEIRWNDGRKEGGSEGVREGTQ